MLFRVENELAAAVRAVEHLTVRSDILAFVDDDVLAVHVWVSLNETCVDLTSAAGATLDIAHFNFVATMKRVLCPSMLHTLVTS